MYAYIVCTYRSLIEWLSGYKNDRTPPLPGPRFFIINPAAVQANHHFFHMLTCILTLIHLLNHLCAKTWLLMPRSDAMSQHRDMSLHTRLYDTIPR